jgi:hypothetical protein
MLHLNNVNIHYMYISVNPVHNAQVCYFNNVWFMFLVLKKKNLFKQPLVPPPSPRSFAFLAPALYPVDAHPPGPSHSTLQFFTSSSPPPSGKCDSPFPVFASSSSFSASFFYSPRLSLSLHSNFIRS